MTLGGIGCLLALAACGTDPGDRPENLQYITTAILTPTCAASNCHSAMVQQRGWRFDSVDAFRAELPALVTPGDPDSSFLYIVLTRESDTANDAYRMPRDAPMPQGDIDLIHDWIEAGAPEAE
jgi:hypothetical protein